MERKRLPLFIIIIFFLNYNLGADESVRCDGALIDIGELLSTVLHKCGEPTDTIEYTAHSTVHQRFILSKSTNKRILLDEFHVQGSFEKPEKEINEDIDEKEMHNALTRMSLHDSKDKFTYKKFNIQRKIINSEIANAITSQYVYWEVIRNDYKMKKLIYNMGPTQFVRILTFKNGELWKMDFREYGY